MSTPPADRHYSPTHQWARRLGLALAEVGITAYAQDALGDIVFADLPKVGARLIAGEPFMVIESVKTASDVHAPLSGVVTEVNDALRDRPETLNTDPYGAWLVRVAPAAAPDAPPFEAQLMDAGAYSAIAAG